MGYSKLVIDDESLKEIGKFIKDQSNNVEAMIQDYLDILSGVNSYGIKSGKTTEALSLFIEYAKQIQGKIYEIGELINEDISVFLDEIDDKDNYLFD